MKLKKGQQEIAGFVLIVVLVVIALMIFLIISVRKTPEEVQSLEVENMLSAVMKYKTDCAIVYEPDYDNIEDLVKSCYDNARCTNLDKMACAYLNESLQDIMSDLMKSESTVGAYELDIFHRDSEERILFLFDGNCTGSVSGAQKNIMVDSGDIIVRLRLCYL